MLLGLLDDAELMSGSKTLKKLLSCVFKDVCMRGEAKNAQNAMLLKGVWCDSHQRVWMAFPP